VATGAPQARTVAAVLDQIRGLIVNRELQPGEQIRQEEMARILGVSRVPLREALRVLAAEGLLTHRPHQGYFVTKMSTENLEQIHTLLEFLETELLRTARWPADEEVAGLRRINAEYARAAEAGDALAMSARNKDLHERIFDLSPLEVIRAEQRRFWTLSEPYRLMHIATTDPQVTIDQHEQIIDALAARDRALTLRASAEHRHGAQMAARNLLLSGPRPVQRPLAAS
jgi:DNA-binding GntR family transcriptional regulator